MAAQVIDLSEYQSSVDFTRLKQAGIAGSILRCGYSRWGSGKQKREDSRFQAAYQAAMQAGMPVGAYYYSTASTEDEAKAEAEFTLALLEGMQFAYPIYWDTEDGYHQAKLSKARLTQVAKAYLETVEGAGYYVGVYSYLYWLQSRLDMTALSAYDVWVAQYNDTLDYSGAYGMWQYTSTGTVPGVNGAVDLNWAYRDYPSIIREAGLNGFGKRKIQALVVYQTWLASRYGYRIVADGLWGPTTRLDSIKAMQTEMKLVPDGVWGTRSKAECPVVGYGQQGPYVWILQGCLQPHVSLLPVDGVFGDRTLAAVKEFQQKAGLVADGQVGTATFTALFA